jgi:hypothetical protein
LIGLILIGSALVVVLFGLVLFGLILVGLVLDSLVFGLVQDVQYKIVTGFQCLYVKENNNNKSILFNLQFL